MAFLSLVQRSWYTQNLQVTTMGICWTIRSRVLTRYLRVRIEAIRITPQQRESEVISLIANVAMTIYYRVISPSDYSAHRITRRGFHITSHRGCSVVLRALGKGFNVILLGGIKAWGRVANFKLQISVRDPGAKNYEAVVVRLQSNFRLTITGLDIAQSSRGFNVPRIHGDNGSMIRMKSNKIALQTWSLLFAGQYLGVSSAPFEREKNKHLGRKEVLHFKPFPELESSKVRAASGVRPNVKRHESGNSGFICHESVRKEG
ncbi:hypothetical protein BJ138DRAFT_1099886 [Hygrophoropsis aurantiaca]|uniref:Uncharacterized protein n=1 Tax=Hygrophoropsis aurantiaca TaxID=72124 RepID=A0ACB8AJ86_9AGAM|nr:hypothetical protein BJ138DRAFT_1099886 [Hygrophoropsis aurantiaca]